MIPLQILSLAFGTTLIRFFHRVRRRISWEKYFSFSDFLIEERHVQSRGFIYLVLPALIGGFLMALVPGIHPLTVTASGFLAAFIGVWPVFQFPDQLLDEYLLRRWGKLKFLYVLFVGLSAALAYLGWLLCRTVLPLGPSIAGARAWQQFLDSLAANAIYDLLKFVFLFLLVSGGIYLNTERKRLGLAIQKEREEDWKKEMEGRS